MPIQLDKFSDYVKLPGLLNGLSWICFECLSLNRPTTVVCVACDKQRWSQLGLRYHDALTLARGIE